MLIGQEIGWLVRFQVLLPDKDVSQNMTGHKKFKVEQYVGLTMVFEYFGRISVELSTLWSVELHDILHEVWTSC